MRKFRLKVVLDIDDVLFECNRYAVELANKEHGFNPPLTVEEITTWGKSGDPKRDSILKYFSDPYFFETQPVIEGASYFVHKLMRKAEVFVVTAVPPEMMGIRIRRLLDEFPMIPRENIIMGSRKDLVQADIMLDDGAHNIIASKTTYPVLFRKPWNQHMTGCLSVNTYDEFLTFVDTIATGYQEKSPSPSTHTLHCFIGPSGSGKTKIIEHMVECEYGVKVPSYTTRSQKEDEPDTAYHFVSKETFTQMEREEKFFETTRYAGECYGSSLEDIKAALEESDVVMALDICGAIAMKNVFKDSTELIFVNRDKRLLIENILSRNISDADKVNRIISLNDELKNEELCDYVMQNNLPVEEVVSKYLMSKLHKNKRKHD